MKNIFWKILPIIFLGIAIITYFLGDDFMDITDISLLVMGIWVLITMVIMLKRYQNNLFPIIVCISSAIILFLLTLFVGAEDAWTYLYFLIWLIFSLSFFFIMHGMAKEKNKFLVWFFGEIILVITIFIITYTDGFIRGDTYSAESFGFLGVLAAAFFGFALLSIISLIVIITTSKSKIK